MKLWEHPWDQTFELLAVYRLLSPATRKALASAIRTSGYTPITELGGAADELAENGFLRLGSRTAAIREHARDFIRLLRALHRHPILETATRDSLAAYVHEHFTNHERAQVAGLKYEPPKLDNLLDATREPDWIERFLSGQNGSSVKDSLDLVVRRLIELDKPVRLDQLPDLFPDVAPANWKPLLQSAMFHLVLFPAIDTKSFEVIIGIWPELAKTGKAVPPPSQAAAGPAASFQAPLLVEDITALLVACAADPPKLRGGDGGLYINSVKAIAPSLAAVPEWIASRLGMSPESRLAKARSRCTDLSLTSNSGASGDARLEISDRGRRWLSLSLAKRTQATWDAMLGDVSEHMPELRVHYKESIVSTYISIYSTVSRRTDFTEEILTLFRDLPDDTWHVADDLLAYWRTMKNPFLEIYRKDPNARVSVSYTYSNGNTTERMQQDWQKVLMGFADARLFPFGGIAYGRDASGRLLLAITPAGRYYLGQSAEFALEEQPGGRILVQPNFEIMFLGPSPAAEAELGRFAERRGRGVGVLFQITRKSIYGAAAIGLAADAVIETLDRLTAKSMPENVRREIRGWFAQTRRVRFEPVVLIHCQDEQTAARVMGMTKGAATPITPTILRYRDHQRQQSALMKKLRESGVLVETGAPKDEFEGEGDE